MTGARRTSPGSRLGRAAVSVVLCTYQRAAIVGRAIRSVLAQTCAELELVVVDDGSTDGTRAVVERIARRDPRVRYVRQRNRGLAAARNVGIARSSAPWVTFLDSDDRYEPGHLAARMRLVRSDVDAIFGGVSLRGPRKLHWCADVDRPGKKIHIARCHVGGTLFVRRAVLDALGGFDPTFGFGEDHELMRRIEASYRVAHCTARTYVYDLSRRDRLGALFLRGGEAAIAEHRKRFTRRG